VLIHNTTGGNRIMDTSCQEADIKWEM